MFGLFKRKSSVPELSASMRDTLFGDVPLSEWPESLPGERQEPWRSFVRAREALAHGRAAEAVALWRRIVRTPGLKSRHHLQAWHFLRLHGVQPSAVDAKVLLGIVLEVPVQGGLDLLAVYADRSARYYNHGCCGLIWDRPDASLDAHIDVLLYAGRHALDAIGPWEKPRPPAPPRGQARLNFLSPAGLHFGQGAFEVLSDDPLGGPVIEAGTLLLQQIVARDVPGT